MVAASAPVTDIAYPFPYRACVGPGVYEGRVEGSAFIFLTNFLSFFVLKEASSFSSASFAAEGFVYFSRTRFPCLEPVLTRYPFFDFVEEDVEPVLNGHCAYAFAEAVFVGQALGSDYEGIFAPREVVLVFGRGGKDRVHEAYRVDVAGMEPDNGLSFVLNYGEDFIFSMSKFRRVSFGGKKNSFAERCVGVMPGSSSSKELISA